MDQFDLNPAILASDTVDQQAGLFSRVSDGIIKGGLDAVVSGGLSIYNTFLDYTGQEAVDASDWIHNKLGDNFGDYYDQNKENIDLAGFIGTSLIPGTLGIKALKLARSGVAVGAIGRALGMTTDGAGIALSRAEAALNGGLQGLAKTGGTIDATIQQAKTANMIWNVADNVLMSAAAETAVAITMSDSPVLDGQSKWDMAKNIGAGALFGGVLGGALDTWAARGLMKKAAGQIEKSKRSFDTVFDYARTGLSNPDEVANFTREILTLPEDFYNTTFNYTYQGTKKSIVLDTADAFKSARNSAERIGLDKVAAKFNDLAGGNLTGQSFFDFIKSRIVAGKTAGQDGDTIWDTVSGYLSGLKSVKGLTEEDGSLEGPKQFFVNNKPSGLHDVFSETRSAATGKSAYYIADDLSKAKFTSVGQAGWADAQEAFDAGYDVVFTTKGRVAVNPKSAIIKKTPDAALSGKYYLDLESGSLTPTAEVTAADLLRNGEDFSWSSNGVKIGKKFIAQAGSKAASLEESTVDASSRFMWANHLDARAFKDRTIDQHDFALLDRAASFPDLANRADVQIALKDGQAVSFADLVDPKKFINGIKIDWLRDQLAEQGQHDIRKLATHLNQSRDWVEKAIGGNFAHDATLLDSVQPLDKYFRPSTVKLEWDNKLPQVVDAATGRSPSIPAVTGPNFQVSKMLGEQYRAKVREQVWNDAADAVLGATEAQRFIAPDVKLSLSTNSQGAGASGFGAANADYGAQAEAHVQQTGKNVHNLIERRKEDAIGKLAPAINSVRSNLDASAELGVLTTALRRDPEKYYLVKDFDTDKFRLVDRDAVRLFNGGDSNFATLDDAIDSVKTQKGSKGVYEIQNPEVGDLLDAHREQNRINVGQHTTMANAMGVSRKFDPDVIYAPPVDTRKYPFFAFVRAKPRIGQASEVSMITAPTADKLKEMAAKVPDEYEVLYKEDTKRFFQAKGEYDYSQQLNESTVNSALQRSGVLADFFPASRPENVLEDWVRFHGNQQANLVRTAVQLKNRQFVNELQFLSDQFQQAGTSQFRGVSALLRKNIADPFQDHIKTMLDFSKQGEYPLMDSLNEFVDKIGRTASVQLDNLMGALGNGSSKETQVSVQRMQELMDYHGLPQVYNDNFQAYLQANQKFGGNLIKDTLTKVNGFLANTILRWDFINPLINTISTPIMTGTEVASIKKLMKSDPELVGKLAQLTEQQVPGQDFSVPSHIKLIYGAVKNFFSDEKDALIERYTKNGDINTLPKLFHEMLGDLAYEPKTPLPKWKEKLEAAMDKGGKITGNDWAEQFTRFVSADVMRQLSEPLVQAGKMTAQEQDAYISIFVNRVQGNYVPSQRPIIFQGTTGGAIGLFQTYAFNVYQQLFRHIEQGNTKAALTFAGLQSSVYGLNGLPFFDAINQHLIGSASGNTQHTDAYTAFPRMSKDIGDWLLYGTASAFPLFGEKAPALYSRGDLNPRNLSVIPINPLDIPAVSASIKLATAIKDFGQKVSGGADISQAMLQAVEHHGWSRPLAGFAQVLAGQSTTSKGDLISSANDLNATTVLGKAYSRLVDFGGVTRMLGAKPMDEAITLNELYRNKQYDALDRQRVEALGQAVKTKLYNNQMPDDEELTGFMQDYAKAGGRVNNFSSAMQRWMKDANTSTINQMALRMTRPDARRMQEVMGGIPLQDYSSLAGVPESED
jgi:hypothetical protein